MKVDNKKETSYKRGFRTRGKETSFYLSKAKESYIDAMAKINTVMKMYGISEDDIENLKKSCEDEISSRTEDLYNFITNKKSEVKKEDNSVIDSLSNKYKDII